MKTRIVLITAALLVGISTPVQAQDNSSPASRAAIATRGNESAKSGSQQKTAQVNSQTRNLKKLSRIPRFVGTSNFNPASHGFTFANWRGEPISQEMSISLLIQLFGQKSVCQEIVEEHRCVPFAKAAQFSEQLAFSITNGRCEGMTVLASNLFARGETAASFSQSDVDSEILYWWASQILPSVIEASRKTRLLDPVELLPFIVNGISQGASSTLGLYFRGQGHTLLPFRSHQVGDLVIIDVYDSNTPGITQQLSINTVKRSWTYQTKNTNGEINLVWNGKGAGTLDVIPLSVRQPQATNFFTK